jgi:hypothetical protein
MKIDRHGSAVWGGGIRDGKDAMTTKAGCPVSKLLKIDITLDAKLVN